MLIGKTASKVRQGSLAIYTTSLKVSDLMVPNFYKVDKLDASGGNSGFQRALDKTRARGWLNQYELTYGELPSLNKVHSPL